MWSEVVAYFLLAAAAVVLGYEPDGFEHMYELGKESYLEEDWGYCVKFMEEAVRDYNSYRESLAQCRRKCECQEKGFEPLMKEDVEDIQFYERKVKTTLCLIKQCNLRSEEIPSDMADELDRKMPYNYLQLCYLKLNDIEKATNAAFTYLTHNPDDKVAQSNFNWYINEVTKTDPDFVSVDSEAHDHTVKYEAGTKAYTDQQWTDVISQMEAAVTSYLEAENQCRRNCEKPFDMGWFPEFVVSMSNHFTFCLKCKRKCKARLSNLRDVPDNPHVLTQMYFYLMFAYYKVGDLKRVGSSIASHQLLDPNHQVMRENMDFFINEGTLDKDWLVPREETVLYHHRDLYELKLDNFIQEEFVFENDGDKFDLGQQGEAHNSDSSTENMHQEPKIQAALPQPPQGDLN